ncbi:MAG: large conductance mechanosensitive channel protein MscL [Methanomicrobia archaeon]|nr:large conductance mechanosensitive channel protein MscL [Methanomicrobia archaeon]
MKKFLEEFKAFITRGNVLDLAVGVIIGGAFQKIVSSLVNDILMPLISGAVGVDLVDWVWVIKPAIYDPVDPTIIDKAAIVMRYGNFIQTVIDFLIIAFVLFVIIKVVVASAKARAVLKEKIVHTHEDKKEE